MSRVLIVDDEAPIRRALETNLGARGHDVRRKLEPDPARPCYVLTQPGMGYRVTAARGEQD